MKRRLPDNRRGGDARKGEKKRSVMRIKGRVAFGPVRGNDVIQFSNFIS